MPVENWRHFNITIQLLPYYISGKRVAESFGRVKIHEGNVVKIQILSPKVFDWIAGRYIWSIPLFKPTSVTSTQLYLDILGDSSWLFVRGEPKDKENCPSSLFMNIQRF